MKLHHQNVVRNQASTKVHCKDYKFCKNLISLKLFFRKRICHTAAEYKRKNCSQNRIYNCIFIRVHEFTLFKYRLICLQIKSNWNKIYFSQCNCFFRRKWLCNKIQKWIQSNCTYKNHYYCIKPFENNITCRLFYFYTSFFSHF